MSAIFRSELKKEFKDIKKKCKPNSKNWRFANKISKLETLYKNGGRDSHRKELLTLALDDLTSPFCEQDGFAVTGKLARKLKTTVVSVIPELKKLAKKRKNRKAIAALAELEEYIFGE